MKKERTLSNSNSYCPTGPLPPASSVVRQALLQVRSPGVDGVAVGGDRDFQF